MAKSNSEQSDKVRREIKKADDLAKRFAGGGTPARKTTPTRNNK